MAETLSFSRSLYAPEAVDEAVAAYARLARFEVALAEHEIRVTVADPRAEVAAQLVDAFSNHVLFATIVRSRSAA